MHVRGEGLRARKRAPADAPQRCSVPPLQISSTEVNEARRTCANALNRPYLPMTQLLHFGSLRSRAPSMRDVFRTLSKVAPIDLSVLITGASGVGKTRIARALHEASPRAAGPIVVLECGGVPDALIESTLFGHTEGAFTGAVQAQLGVFRAAHGGTLILDELGAASAALQVALLRALEDRVVTPLGSTASFPVDLRVLATTALNLPEEIAAQRFREDLYYRVAVVIQPVPALDARREDLALLAGEIVETLRSDWQRPALALSAAAQKSIQTRRWPGNIRELENAIRRGAALADGDTIGAEHLPLPPALSFPDEAPTGDALDASWVRRGPIAIHADTYALPLLRDALEALAIDRALTACDGNQSEAAKLLDMPRRTLVHKLAERRAKTQTLERPIQPSEVVPAEDQVLDRSEAQKRPKRDPTP